MSSILKSFHKIIIGLSVVFGILLLVFMMNQFVSLFDLLNRIHPILALIVTLLLAGVVIYFLTKILLLWFRSSKLAVLPENPTPQQLDAYYDQMIIFLKKNKHLKSVDFDNLKLTKQEKVDLGFKELDNLSNPMIKKNASEIFLTTAISQNGALDSIAVLVSLTKMIFQLANVYQTRPSLKSLGKLYLQVGSVVFMARTIEDTDLLESQIEPLVAAVIGESLASAIPGMVPITNLIISSMMEGSLNALLTLRVGIITQSYLGTEKPESKSFIQKSTSLQALSLLGSIIKDNGKLVAKSMMNAAKSATTNTAKKWFKFD